MSKSPLITSTSNPLIKRIRALARRDRRSTEGRIVVEGVRMIEEVLAAAIPVEMLVYDASLRAATRADGVLAAARRARVRLVPASARVVAACSHVETAQGLIAVVEKPRAKLAAVIEAKELLLVIADRIQDPGNLGTIIRIADAAGATAVAVTTGSVDPYNPKSVRATMGSLFHLPVIEVGSGEAVEALKANGVRVLVADQTGAIDYADADYRRPVAIVLGNEGQGPDLAWVEAAAGIVRIPLYGRAESLNVAVSAGLLLYEARRTSAEPT